MVSCESGKTEGLPEMAGLLFAILTIYRPAQLIKRLVKNFRSRHRINTELRSVTVASPYNQDAPVT